MTDTPSLARTLQVARYQKDLSLRQLHEASGVSLKTLHRLEAGVGNPHGRTLFRLAKALDLDPYQLLDLGESA